MLTENIYRKLVFRKNKIKYPLDIYPSCFDHKKCIFFHIPKVGGTSVCLALFGYQVGHLYFNQLYNSNPKKAMTYFKFTLVRNPWDRLVSAYHFLLSGGMNSSDESWAKNNLAEYDGFEDFVKKWINNKNIYTYIHFVPQYEFISDINGVVKADFIGKIENIDNDIKKISSTLNTEIKLNKLNGSKQRPYTEYYNDETKKIVFEVYEKDITLFGYEFGR